tara:strand:+ start:36 stop:1184 length:1149 start_codon:yes stop_codon:yes gene_type:complete
MPHLLEEYAKNLGVKISKPIVKEHFFPIGFEKYITVCPDQTNNSRNYKHYPVVFFILKQFLEKHGIKVIQLGGAAKIDGVDAALNLPFKQQAYVISKSLLNLGCDGETAHVSSVKKRPTVTLFGNTFAAINKPMFCRSSLMVNLEPKWNKKPSFSNVSDDINNILPETVAQSIIKLLKIENCKVNFKTIRAGAAYTDKIVEVVPTTFYNLSLQPNQELFIRADYGINKDAFVKYCQNYKVSIFSKALLKPDFIKTLAPNINNIFLRVKKEDDIIPDSYFKIIKNMNINLILLAERKKDINYLRNIYFDAILQEYRPENKDSFKIKNNYKILTAKRLISEGKEYLSEAHWEKNLDNNNKMLDGEKSLSEIELFYIYEQSQKNN